MVLCVFPWTKGQMGRSVVNSNVFVVSKRRSVVNSRVFHSFAWSKGGHVEKCHVFVCFCSVERGECRKVSSLVCFSSFVEHISGLQFQLERRTYYLINMYVNECIFMCIYIYI